MDRSQVKTGERVKKKMTLRGLNISMPKTKY